MDNIEVNREPSRGSNGLHADPPLVEKRDPRAAEFKEVGAGSAMAESLTGIGVLALAILALIGVLPLAFAGIAVIVAGASLLLEGGAIAARLYSLRARVGIETPGEVAGGLSAESLAGIGGIALGILALASVRPLILLPVAVILFGAGMLFASVATTRVNHLSVAGPIATTGEVVRDSVYAASDAHVLVGIGAIVLGILALTGTAPLVLSLVALLGIAISETLSGGAIGGKLLTALHR